MAARPATGIVDSHVHLWDRSRFRYGWIGAGSALDRDVLPADLLVALADQPVSGGVLVEAASTTDEISWLVACAAQLPGDWGVVGSLPLDQPNSPDQIARWALEPRFKGIRLNWLERHRDTAALRPALYALADYGLILDVLCTAAVLPEIASFAREHEDVTIVLNHLAGIPLGRNHLSAMHHAIELFSRLSNVAVKVSGFASDASDCDVVCLRAALDVFDGVFGPGRMLFGSDYPLSLISRSYADVITLAVQATAGREPRWREALFSQTARTLYRLQAVIPLESTRR